MSDETKNNANENESMSIDEILESLNLTKQDPNQKSPSDISVTELINAYPSKEEFVNRNKNEETSLQKNSDGEVGFVDEYDSISDAISEENNYIEIENVNDFQGEFEDISEEKAPEEHTDEYYEDEFEELNEEEDDFDEDYDDEFDDDDFDDEFDDENHVRRGKKRFAGGGIIFGLLLSTLIVSISILSAAYILLYSKEVFGIEKPDVEYIIDVPENSSSDEIAGILLENGIIEEKTLFKIVTRIKGADGSFVAGTHTLRPNMTYFSMIEELGRTLSSGEIRAIKEITFPEGITLYAAANILEENGICDADEFIKSFNTSEFGYSFEDKVSPNMMKFYKLEGYLFPDTYEFYVDEDPRIVTKAIYKNFNLKLTADIYGRIDDMNMELEQVLTFASIVQAEANNKNDMKLVASVFHNRLNNPSEFPLLQSDPTRKYVEDIIVPNSEITSETRNEAYNTYIGAGLPPGPINNPGLEAINAVLYPSESEYFYFCADVNTGEVFYAVTLAEHEQNLVLAGITQ